MKNRHLIQTLLIVLLGVQGISYAAVDDVTPPVITLNQLDNATIGTLSDIEILLEDESTVSIDRITLTGGPDNVDLELSHDQISLNKYKVSSVYLSPTAGEKYFLTVYAADENANTQLSTLAFSYAPKVVVMQDVTIPAIASPLRAQNGVPHNVLLTPLVKNESNQLAKGVHDVFFTLLPEATSSLVVEDQLVAPGETIVFKQNLSATQSRVNIVIYPQLTGDVSESEFSIQVPNIRVSLCPENFTPKSVGKCTFLDIKASQYTCADPFTLDGSQCNHEISYEPTTECVIGYNRDDLTCSGSYTTAQVSECPTNFGLVDSETCRQHTTIKADTCPQGQTVENGMCTDGQQFYPTGAYCGGVDMSSGKECQGATCTEYNPDWNSCEVTTTVPAEKTCPKGEAVGSQCIIPHEYDLNATCQFGYVREGLACNKLEIIPALKMCDTDWELSQDTTYCMQTLYQDFESCPDNHILEAGRCHQIDDVIITCSATFDWEDPQCHRTVTSVAEPLCPVDFTWNSTKSQCEQPQEIPATAQCPGSSVWVEANNRCEYTQTLDATPVCPINMAWVDANQRCEDLQTIPATPICVSPQYWNGTACQLDEVQDATPQCDNSYSWNGSTCLGTETIPATQTDTCPVGTVDVNNGCEETTISTVPASVSYSCPDSSWTLSGSTCEKTTTTSTSASTSYSCPDASWTRSGTTCNKTTTTTTSASTSYSCPDASWTRSGTTCNKTTTTTTSASTSYSCPDSSWTLSGSTCKKTTTTSTSASTSYSCPDASWTRSGTTCTKTTTTSTSASTSYSCPDSSWTLSGSTCKKTTTTSTSASTSYSCPDSSWTLLNGYCSKETKIRIGAPYTQGYTCAIIGPGWVLLKINGSYYCELTSYEAQAATATKYCPVSGDRLSGSTCYRDTQQSISATATKYCPVSGDRLSGSTCYRDTVTTQAATATKYCPVSTDRLSGSTCYRDTQQSTSATATKYCPVSGDRLSGSTCYRDTQQSISATATKYCSVSTDRLSGSTCYRDTQQSTSATATKYCPVSTDRLSGSTCYRDTITTQAATATKYCSNNTYTLDGNFCTKQTVVVHPYDVIYSCLTAQGWGLNGQQCDRPATADPIDWVCSSTWQANGLICERTRLLAPSSYDCNAPWAVNGAICEQLFTDPPTGYSCNAPYLLDVQMCVWTQLYAADSYQCDAGWSLDVQMCRRTLFEPLDGYFCNDGWDLNGQQCSMDEYETETRSCNPSWTLISPSECQKDAPEDFVGNCSQGWNALATRCSQDYTDAVTYYCNPEYELSTTQCKRTLTEPVNVICNTGEVEVNGLCVMKESSTVIRTCDAPYTKSGTYDCKYYIEIDDFDQL